MKSLIILTLFVVTALSQTEVDPKSVRLALETSFLFHPEDANQDLGFVKNLKKFLGKIEKVLEPSRKRFRAQVSSNKTVIEYFLKKISKQLVKLNDADLRNVVQVFQTQIKSNDYPGSVWHKILTVPRLKGFVRETIKKWSQTDPLILKENLRSYIEKSENGLLNNFISVLEDYYTSQDRKGLKKFTKKLMKRTEDINVLIKKTIHNYIFERYESLNDTEKARIAYEIIKISENLSHNDTVHKKVRRSLDENQIIERHVILDRDLHVNVEKLDIIPPKEPTTERYESFLERYHASNNIEDDSSDSD